jgi:hypothetical protein
MAKRQRLAWPLLAAMLAACASAPDAERAAAPADTQDIVIPAAQGELDRETRIESLPAGLPIRVLNPFGDVRVRFGGYESKLEWRFVAQNPEGAPPLSVETAVRDAFSLAVSLPPGATQRADQRLDLTLYIAEKHDLAIETQAGLIEVRGLRADLSARSRAGNISFRGITGRIDVHTDSGAIEGQFEGPLPGSTQRVETATGNIVLGLSDRLNARLMLASSAPFATDFSIAVEPQPGQEPNKRGSAELGKPESTIEVFSKRGELRLLRRVEFQDAAPGG